MQAAFSEKVSSREVNMKFMNFNEFQSVRKLENVLLALDDSCEDIYNDKEFVRLGTRYKILSNSDFWGPYY